MTDPKQAKVEQKEIREFLWMAYCGLVLRGYDSERSIGDPILRKVWRYGKRIALSKGVGVLSRVAGHEFTVGSRPLRRNTWEMRSQ